MKKYAFVKKELVGRGTIPKNKWITLHSLRHGRVVDLLNKGYGLDIVGDYVGHKDIKTTMVYAHSNSRKKKLLKEIQKDLDRGTMEGKGTKKIENNKYKIRPNNPLNR